MKNRTLLVIDGSHLAYKAMFSVLKYKSRELSNPSLSDKDIDKFITSETCITMCNMIKKFMKKWRPTHAAIVFDDNKRKLNFRSELLPTYKTHREKKKLHKDSYEVFKNVISSLGIKSVEVPEGFEADDMIGSLATEFKDQVKKVYIYSGDKDFDQLVNQKIIRLDSTNRRSGHERMITRFSIKRKWNIFPDQVVDYKALVGDRSDGYSGIPQIGPQTASQLLSKYHTLDNIYRNIENIEPVRLRELLVDGEERAQLSKMLARIVVNLRTDKKLNYFTRLYTNKDYNKKLKEIPTIVNNTLTYEVKND